ncbi:hypothetical protein M011DRAFT_515822 [Sporormia fimetaria CBS 119925]|uniref:Uncharacterized protein n=1 Tax=Sporormia fimetaria CBS 119925 TaxID=1340428 RepID=A0A6A6VE12_9PLEO|nr:hypothetical protein M011DRAFT_515822 [Sporormia fimetaria CBS 119925]
MIKFTHTEFLHHTAFEPRTPSHTVISEVLEMSLFVSPPQLAAPVITRTTIYARIGMDADDDFKKDINIEPFPEFVDLTPAHEIKYHCTLHCKKRVCRWAAEDFVYGTLKVHLQCTCQHPKPASRVKKHPNHNPENGGGGVKKKETESKEDRPTWLATWQRIWEKKAWVDGEIAKWLVYFRVH